MLMNIKAQILDFFIFGYITLVCISHRSCEWNLGVNMIISSLFGVDYHFFRRLRDPLQSQLQPSRKLIQSSEGWRLHMKHCRLYHKGDFPWDCSFFLGCWYFRSALEQDAAGLTQLSSTVEDVFASGDLPRAADTLATMRHCLTAVGEVFLFLNNLLKISHL